MKTIEEKAKAYDEALERAKGMRALPADKATVEYIFPELCESEDERNIDTIFNCLYQCCDTGFISGTQRDNALDWLEKQKELFESGRGLYYYDGEKTTYCGYPATEENPYDFAMSQQKEQKPIEFKNDELVEIIKGEFEGFRNLLKKKGIDYEPQRTYWEGFARLFDSSAREYVKEQKEQKPAWSEEDEKHINNILDIIDYWKATARFVSYQDGTAVDRDINWLKSLRPQAKPEVTDEEIEEMVTKAGKKYWYDKIRNRFLSKRNQGCNQTIWSRPSWKPSDEQMNVFKNTLERLRIAGGTGTWYATLESLYEQLKKL